MIKKMLEKQMASENLELVEMIPIPHKGDRLIRLQTVEEALDEFDDQQNSDTVSYLVQVKKKNTSGATAMPSSPAQTVNDPIRLENGKLNAAFLEKQATVLANAKEFKTARKIYSTILKENPPTYSILMGLGTCLSAEGRLDDAIQVLEHAQAYEGTLDVQMNLLQLYLKNQQIPAALEKIDRLISRPTVDHEVRMSLLKTAVDTCISNQRKDRAENYCLKAISIEPENNFFRRKLTKLYTEMGRIEDAQQQLKEILKSERKDVEGLIQLAQIKISANNLTEAHDLLCEALEIEPQNGAAIYHLVSCAYSIKKYERAAQFLSQYVDLGPINPNLMYSLAGLYFHLGQYSLCKNTARRVLSMKNDHQGAKNLIALIEKL